MENTCKKISTVSFGIDETGMADPNVKTINPFVASSAKFCKFCNVLHRSVRIYVYGDRIFVLAAMVFQDEGEVLLTE